MSANPSLWRYGVAPIVMNLFITGLLLFLLVVGGVYFFPAMHGYFDGGWLWRIVEACAVVAAAAIGVAAVAAAWIILQAILCGWFYDRLARQVELQQGAAPEDLIDAPLAAQAVDALRAVGFLLAANAGCLLVQLAPVVGSALGVCGSYYFTAATLGFEFFDYPMSLRGMRRAEKLAFARRHRLQTFGLGTSVAVLAFVPVLNAVFLTTAVTGAVLLHKRLSPVSSTNEQDTQPA